MSDFYMQVCDKSAIFGPGGSGTLSPIGPCGVYAQAGALSRPPTGAICLRELPSPGDQVDDQDDQSYDQQNVNQAAGDMKAEAQEP